MTTDIKMKEIFNREIYFMPINQLRDLVEYLKLLHVLEYKDYNLQQIIDEINNKWDNIEFRNKIEMCYRIQFEEGVESMKRVAMFEKVSFEQFKKDWINTFGENWLSELFGHLEDLEEIYGGIKLPARSSSQSAGYDFFAPIPITLAPNETIKLPTGIRCYMEDGWVLKCYPRSGLGFKYRLQLDNSVGIIDKDYYYSDNEGHIFVKLTNDTKEEKTLTIQQDNGMFQGIFVEYGITMNDVVEEIRNGGFGSSDK